MRLRLGCNTGPRKSNAAGLGDSHRHGALVNDFPLELTPDLIVYLGSKPDKAV